MYISKKTSDIIREKIKELDKDNKIKDINVYTKDDDVYIIFDDVFKVIIDKWNAIRIMPIDSKKVYEGNSLD